MSQIDLPDELIGSKEINLLEVNSEESLFFQGQTEFADLLYDPQCELDLERRENSKSVKSQEPKPFVCDQDHCAKSFTRKDRLIAHQLTIHKIDNRNFSVKCLNCSQKFKTRSHLISHLNEVHEECVSIEKNSLNSSAEFEIFKTNLAKETGTTFVKSRGQSGNVIIFECSRSGVSRIVQEDRRKNDLSFQGTSKIDGCCTAFIKLEISNGNYQVEYCKSHYGHPAEIKHLNLDDHTIARILELGRAKVDQREIYRQIRTDFRDRKIRASNLISMDQIRYHLKKIGCDLTSDDFKNLELLFKKESQLSPQEQFVRAYKPRNQMSDEFPNLNREQFFMVLMNQFQIKMVQKFNVQIERTATMDATHGLNNKKVLLITIVIVDEFGNGVPIAFCLSERENEQTITAFLQCVRRLAGQINAEFFMSDDADAYFNSWKVAMGDATKILCSWHVFKNWKQNVRAMVKSTDKQEQLLKMMVSIRDEQLFEVASSRLERLIVELEKKSSTKEFGKYLKYYTKRLDQWLYCRRRALIPNTNMHIENLHRLIKVIFLSCKRIQKISRCVEILREIIEQKMIDRLVKTTKRKNDKSTRRIFEEHQKAVEEIANYNLGLFYIDEELGAKVYEVVNPTNLKYYVTQVDLVDHSCEHCCKHCTICPHFMSCSCRWFRVKGTCKHIHMVAIDFEIICCNLIKEESSMNNFIVNKDDLCRVDSADDEPSAFAVEFCASKPDEKQRILADLAFYQNELVGIIKKLDENDDVDGLYRLKTRNSGAVSSFVEVNGDGLQENTRKRKLDHQKRFPKRKDRRKRAD